MAPLAGPAPRGLRIEIAPKTIFAVLGVVAGVWVLGKLVTVLEVVTVALVLVGTFDPIVAWLQRRGLRRGLALVIVFVVAALVLSAVVLLMLPPLVAQLANLIADAPKSRAHLVEALRSRRWAEPLVGAIEGLPLDTLTARAGAAMLGYSSTLFEAIGYGVTTLFLAIYLLADPAHSKALVYAVVPRHHHVKLAKIMLELEIIVGGYVRGQLITSLAIAVFVFALLTAFGADNALALALLAGIADIFPFVGGYIASAPVIIAVTPHGVTVTLLVLGIMVLYQEFESRILVPRIYGRVLRLSPAVVLLALLVGGTLGGMLGALLALPIAAGLQMVIKELRVGLPGVVAVDDRAITMDERANEVYEHLAKDVAVVDAGVIADGLASIVKASEEAAADPEVPAAILAEEHR